MTRWVWKSTVASVAACAGLAAGQAPRPPAADPNVMVIRTAGQPDRRVRVLKSERLPDGKVLTEVKDLDSGEIYTLVDSKAGGATDGPPAPPAARPSVPAAPTSAVTASARSCGPISGRRTVPPGQDEGLHPAARRCLMLGRCAR